MSKCSNSITITNINDGVSVGENLIFSTLVKGSVALECRYESTTEKLGFTVAVEYGRDSISRNGLVEAKWGLMR